MSEDALGVDRICGEARFDYSMVRPAGAALKTVNVLLG